MDKGDRGFMAMIANRIPAAQSAANILFLNFHYIAFFDPEDQKINLANRFVR